MVKNPPAKAGDQGLIPELGRSHGEGNGNTFPHSCLGTPVESGGLYSSRGRKKVRHNLLTE